MTGKILTANRLTDGAVVYRDAAGGWVESIVQAAPAAGEDEEEALLAAAAEAVAARLVVGPYMIEVGVDGSAPAPQSQRERIRAAGPTVPYGRIKV